MQLGTSRNASTGALQAAAAPRSSLRQRAQSLGQLPELWLGADRAVLPAQHTLDDQGAASLSLPDNAGGDVHALSSAWFAANFRVGRVRFTFAMHAHAL
jgi:hypothetical protein